LAIVAIYERFGRSLFHGNASFIRRIFQHAFGIAVTSMVATLATAPFVLYHFNRFALFGLITNMIVIPLATFIIMPGMVLWVLLLPLGLQMVGYYPLAYGVEMMIRMAGWVVSLPYASLHLPSPTDFGLMLAAFGLLWLCLMKTRARLLGVPVIAVGLATLTMHVPVDVFISADARQVMVRLPEGHYTTLKGTSRSFTVQNWLRAEGEDELVPLKETDLECDKTLCTYQQRGRTIIMVRKPQEDDVLDSACARPSDVLIAWRYLHPDRCPGPKMLIGRVELEGHGAHALRLGEDGIHVSRTREKGQGERIWHPRLRPDNLDDD
jgi:competence protein ComEC